MAILSAIAGAISQIFINITKKGYRGRKVFRNVSGYAAGMAVNNVILMALIKKPALRKYSNLLAAFAGAVVQAFIDVIEARIIKGKVRQMFILGILLFHSGKGWPENRNLLIHLCGSRHHLIHNASSYAIG